MGEKSFDIKFWENDYIKRFGLDREAEEILRYFIASSREKAEQFIKEKYERTVYREDIIDTYCDKYDNVKINRLLTDLDYEPLTEKEVTQLRIKVRKELVQEESKNELPEKQYSVIYYITEKDFENNNIYKSENTYNDLEEAKKDLNSMISSKVFFAGKIIDKQTKNEKYCMYEEPKEEKYKYIIKCSLVSDREEFKDQYLLVKNPNELDTQFEIDLTGDFCFNCSFEVVNPKLVKIINSKDELLEFCNQLNIPVSRDYIRKDGFLASGTDGLLINNNLEAVDWLEKLEDVEEI